MNEFLPILLVGAFLMLSGGSMSNAPRGFRNNNPFNIKRNPANNWVGKTGDDGIFEQFDRMEHGVRAGYKLLNTYRLKYGINTPIGITEKFSPTHKAEPTNDHIKYAQFLASQLGLPSIESNIPKSKQFQLGVAIVRYENGKNLPRETMQKGFQLAHG